MTDERRDNLGPDLSAYLDGELPEQRARDIEHLLAQQPALRDQLEQWRAVSDQLGHLPRQRAPGELVAAMHRAAERRELLGPTRPSAAQRTLKLFVRVTAAAAVLVGCMLVGWRVMRDDRAPSVRRTAWEQKHAAAPATGGPMVARGVRAEPGTTPAAPIVSETLADKPAKELDAAGPPGVQVWVTPQDEQQYAAVRAALLESDALAVGAFGPGASATPTGAREPADRWPSVQVSRVIPTAQFATFVSEMEAHAPGQVTLSITLKASDVDAWSALAGGTSEGETSVQAAGAAPSSAERISDVADARAPGTSAKKEAVGRPAAPPSETLPRQMARRGRAPASAPVPGGAAGMALYEASAPDAPAAAARADLLVPKESAQPPATARTEERAVPPETEARAGTVSRHVHAVLRSLLNSWEQTTQAVTKRPPTGVLVRIHLLPPPSGATTLPATSATSVPTPPP